MENLGHNSKTINRAYAKHAQVKIPSLEEYEKAIADNRTDHTKCNLASFLVGQVT
jgi:hypothetical protein